MATQPGDSIARKLKRQIEIEDYQPAQIGDVESLSLLEQWKIKYLQAKLLQRQLYN